MTEPLHCSSETIPTYVVKLYPNSKKIRSLKLKKREKKIHMKIQKKNMHDKSKFAIVNETYFFAFFIIVMRNRINQNSFYKTQIFSNITENFCEKLSV